MQASTPGLIGKDKSFLGSTNSGKGVPMHPMGGLTGDPVMINRNPFFANLFALSMSALAVSPASAGQVISWVAPYGVDQSKAMLQKDFGGVGMKDGLTWLALQFWVTNGP